jgi:hypothetical protein
MIALPALLLLADIAGVVLDPTDAAVPGARVTLQEEDGRPRHAITDVRGAFRFHRVSAGLYRIEVRQEGFQPAAVSLTVSGASPPPLRISLSLADLKAEITVGAQADAVSTEPAGNLDAVTLDQETLENLPVLDQDVVAAASLFLDEGSLGAAGASVVVDGMETSEIGVTASAIQEVRINRNPYSAEFSRPGRGRIEVITKSGASDYHGVLNLQVRDHRLAARNTFAPQRPAEQRRSLEGHLTGPLGRSKRTSFLVAAEREEFDEQSLVYAVTPQGTVRENVPNPSRETEVSARVDREIRPGNRFSLRYEFERESERGSGAGGFSLPEMAVDERSRQHHLYYSHRAVFDARWILDLSVRAGRHTDTEHGRRGGIPRIIVLDAFSGGSPQVDRRESETHLEFAGTLSWSRGRHLLKTGVSLPDWSRRVSDDRDNFGGTFYFSSIEDFLQGRSFAYTAQAGDSRLAFWQKEIAWFVQDDLRLRSNLTLGMGLRYERQNFLNDRNNFSPRFSLAWAPGRRGRTVFRLGAGAFYDRTGAGPMAEVLRYDGHRLRDIAVSNPGYPEPGALTSRPSNVVRFAHDLRSPHLLQSSFGVEHRLLASTTLAAAYTRVRGLKLFRSRDVNAPLPPLWLRPDPSTGILRQIESSAGMNAHSVTIALRGKLAPFFQGTVQYAAGRAENDTGGIESFPADHRDLTGEWSRAGFDERHRLRLAGTFQPENEWFNLGFIFSAGSGRPYSMTTGRDDNRDTLPLDRPPGIRRNTLEEPGAASLDIRWSREFSHDSGWSAIFALDAFNVLNRVNYSQVVGNLSSPLFGSPVAARPARRIQLGLRLKF